MAFVVFAGQSNMGGPFQNASSLQRPWTPDPNTLIWDAQAHAWEPLQPGVNTGYGGAPNGWGPEVAFAEDFRARFPDEPLRIVKAVWGGTQIAIDPVQWSYDWSPNSRDELFDQTTAIVREAGQAAGGIVPTVLFWGQGEQDATSQAAADAYASNLAGFFAAARDAWLHDPAGKIGFFEIGTSPPFSATVRAAQAAVDAADPNATAFDAGAFPHQGDDLHYSAAGLDMAGDDFFQLYAGWRGGAPQAPPPAASDDETLTGTAGPDSMGGGAGHDVMRGGEGDDRMSGGTGFDDMNGNQGNDTLAGDEGDDWVVGGKDNDFLTGGEGDDIVYGNLGDDTCDGGAGADLVRGGQGNDVLTGLSGNDWLSGDLGDDTITGGSGADVFHSFAMAGLDRITDFSAAEGDRVMIDAGTPWTVAQVGADTVVSIGDARVVLVGVAMASLPDGWIYSA